MNNKDLEKIMREQFVPPASSNLSARIIDAAKPPVHKKSFGQSITESFARFLTIPKPALAVATCLMLGLFIYGTLDTNNTAQKNDDIITVDEFWSYVTDDEGNFL